MEWLCNCRNEIEAREMIRLNRFPKYKNKQIGLPEDRQGAGIGERLLREGYIGLFGEKVNK